jgi:soluble lytic murein transglycosylase-like protein
MELNEPNIRTGHPPHSIPYKKNGLSPFRILPKIAIFIIIFLLSFHLPHFNPGFNSRKQNIQEILAVLERHQTGLANVTKEELAEVIYEEATRYNHDPKFILAVIAIESEFHNWSVSEKGAKGLMQMMPYVAQSIAQELGIEWSGDRTLFNPILNIRMGIYYLSRLLLDFDDMELAVTAYNYGPTYVKGLIERKERVPLHYYHRLLTVYQRL